jgi:glycosyltransferase involved in cell wall biosynthesis
MIERIALFLPDKKNHEETYSLTEALQKALERLSIKCEHFVSERENPGPFLEKLFQFSPDLTLSYNGLLPDEEGRFFADLIKIPHLCCLTESPHGYTPLTRSPLSFIGCSDELSCEYLSNLGSSRVFFFPPGADFSVESFEKNRKIDLFLPFSYIDYEAIEAKWRRQHSKALFNALELAAKETLKSPEKGYATSLAEMLQWPIQQKTIIPEEIDFHELLEELDLYIRGKDLRALAEASKEFSLHVINKTHENSKTWRDVLKGSNVTFHDNPSYNEVEELLSSSKIVLNSIPSITFGVNPLFFRALVKGAALITTKNPYLFNTFKEGESLLSYTDKTVLKELPKLISEYLRDDKKREDLVKSSLEVAKKHHTIDARAKLLKDEMAKRLKEKIKTT